jgi:predicted GTPase
MMYLKRDSKAYKVIAYAYDSMIMMSMRCDEHEHRTKSLTLNVKTMVERSPWQSKCKTSGYKALGIKNMIGCSSPTTNNNQSKCKTSEYKAPQHQQ